MKTVVTGGAGFIGSHLVKALFDRGREVTIADDFSRGNRLNLLDLGIQTECHKIDLRDFTQALKATKGAETVFHLAARVGSLDWLHGSEANELEALQTNLVIDANVFRACIENRVKKIIYASSVSVYPIHIQDRPNIVFSEDNLQIQGLRQSTIDPEGGYGWAKFLGEIQLSWIKDAKVGIARIFNTYGENGALGKSAQVIPALIQRAIRYPKEDFIVWGDGKQSRDFLYVPDCVDALLKLEEKASSPPIVVNTGSDQAIAISLLAEKIVEVSGKDIKIKYAPSKPVGPISRTADVTKARNLLGWQAEVDLEEGLKRTYTWLEKRLQRGDCTV